jgi:RNA-directed DNA polymerase
MFVEKLNCAPEPARYLTRLTTLDGGVPQGSPTSTTIANLVIVPLANRLNGLSKKHNAKYTQFVDDISISGPGYIEKLSPVVTKIIQQEGFAEHPDKSTNASSDGKQVVTGISVKNGIDAPPNFIKDVRNQIQELGTFKAIGQEIPVKKVNSIKGKINYIGQLNKGAAKSLRRRLNRTLAPVINS